MGDKRREQLLQVKAADMAPEIQAALVELAKAHSYARGMESDPWEFAVEIERLIARGLTTSDLRWLAKNGYVEHAQEITQPGDEDRRFRSSRNTAFEGKTCFVLTNAGVAITDAQPTDTVVIELAPCGGEILAGPVPTPRWDSQTHTFYVGEQIVKQYKVPSSNQEAILAAFHEEGWPRRVDDPLPPQAGQDAKYRLHYTIHRLNHHQRQNLIRFFGDGTGQGVYWEVTQSISLAHSVSRIRQKCRRAA